MAIETTDILALPYIMPSQAQKHVTHNEAIATLDVVVQAVVDGEAGAPPEAPAPGDRMIVAADATGAFAGHAGAIAAWRDGAWAFLAPGIGWTAYDRTLARVVVFTGVGWEELPPPRALAGLQTVGINATADTGNRLAVASPASLFSHEGTDHRLKVNKAAAANTASLLFQSGYSGRAEFGLTGDDDFHLKVSPDGAAWFDAMRIDRASGKPSFPQGIAGLREVLTADRTYHVRADGDDANDGLADTPGGAFRTIQKAADVVAGLDMGTRQATISVGAGNFPETVTLRPWVGELPPLISGAGKGATSFNGVAAVNTLNGCAWRIEDIGFANSGSYAIHGAGPGVVNFANVDFGGTGRVMHIRAESGFTAVATGNFSISAGTSQQMFYAVGAAIVLVSRTATFLSDIVCTSFVTAEILGHVDGWAMIFNVGSFTVTGKRYQATSNAIVHSGAGGPGYFPGSTAGTTTSGGQYL